MNYLKWNDTIAKHFFNERMARKEVLLYVNESIIQSLGTAAEGIENFIAAIKCGPDWVNQNDFCQKAYQTYDGWRNRHLEYPPYIAYLACCVLAATLQCDDWATHAYYPRLRKILNEPDHNGTLRHIDLMEHLWKDLEKWSNEDKKEELGRFVVRRRGEWCNVGLPLSQTIISDEERKNLSQIFEDAKLDPADIPSPEIIPMILLKHGLHILEKRTLGLLNGSKEVQKILKNALITLILEELEQWNGEIILPPKDQSEDKAERPEYNKRVGLRICLKIDELNKTASSYLRLKTNNPFPEDDLNFVKEGDSNIWSCEEDHEGWSKKIRALNSQPPRFLDAFNVDWKNDFVLIDSDNHWEARLKGSTTRLFVPGQNDNLYDWIESNNLQRGIKFYVVCYGSDTQKVKMWGENSCAKFKKIDLKIPLEGWTFFLGENATVSCPDIYVLSISSLIRLKLKGIRVDTGNTYLKIAPPDIIVKNSSGNEKVTINGMELKKLRYDLPIWKIPPNAPTNQVITVKAIDGTESDTKTLYLVDPELPFAFDSVPYRDAFGGFINKNAAVPKVSGVIVFSEGHENIESYPRILPTNLSERIVFIGVKPGEIVDWPKESLPTEWLPVWAIAKKGAKRWEVNYCGAPEDLIKYERPKEASDDASARKEWKKAIWVNRKINKAPTLKKLLLVWKNYLEAARHA